MITLTAPSWALTIAYWLHMLATVVWIGGLASLSWIILPAARKSISGAVYAQFLRSVSIRLQTVGWFCLAVLGVTGMFQMSSSPFYKGFLAIDSPWAYAILLKHAAIGLMVLVSIYLTWGITPAFQRIAMLQSAGREPDPIHKEMLRRREQQLLNLNLLLSLVILALTAIARAA